jgi:hypothetical protein
MLQTRALRWLRPEVIPLIVLIHLVPWLRTPIQGPHHSWRQADVAAVARNLAFESPDIFHPRIDYRNEKSGITAMEFPLYPALVALPMAATRSDSDLFGKYVSLLAAAAVWWLLVRLMTRRWGLNPWAAHLACAAVPLFSAYSVLFMPEETALLLAVLSALLLDEWWQKPRVRTLALSGLCIALAGLVRPYVIFWGAPLAIAAVIAAVKDRTRLLPLVVTGVLALVPFALWYFVWCPHLVTTYGLDYFYMGGSLKENLAALRSPEFRDLFGPILKRFYLIGICLPLGLIGLELSLRAARASPRPWWDLTVIAVIPPATLLGVCLASGTHFSPHVYYFGIIPSIVIILAFALHWVKRHAPVIFPLLGALIVANSMSAISKEIPYRDSMIAYYDDVVPEVKARVPADDRIIVEDLGSRPWHLNPLRRKGWIVSRDTLVNPAFIADARQKGAKWVVFLDQSVKKYRLATIAEWEQSVRLNPAEVKTGAP